MRVKGDLLQIHNHIIKFIESTTEAKSCKISPAYKEQTARRVG